MFCPPTHSLCISLWKGNLEEGGRWSTGILHGAKLSHQLLLYLDARDATALFLSCSRFVSLSCLHSCVFPLTFFLCFIWNASFLTPLSSLLSLTNHPLFFSAAASRSLSAHFLHFSYLLSSHLIFFYLLDIFLPS